MKLLKPLFYSILVISKSQTIDISSSCGEKPKPEVYLVKMEKEVKLSKIRDIEQQLNAKVATDTELLRASSEGANWCGAAWTEIENGSYVLRSLNSPHPNCSNLLKKYAKLDHYGPNIHFIGLKPERSDFPDCMECSQEEEIEIKTKQMIGIQTSTEYPQTGEETESDVKLKFNNLRNYDDSWNIFEKVQCIMGFKVRVSRSDAGEEIWETSHWSQNELVGCQTDQDGAEDPGSIIAQSVKLSDSLGTTLMFVIVTWSFLLGMYGMILCCSTAQPKRSHRANPDAINYENKRRQHVFRML